MVPMTARSMAQAWRKRIRLSCLLSQVLLHLPWARQGRIRHFRMALSQTRSGKRVSVGWPDGAPMYWCMSNKLPISESNQYNLHPLRLRHAQSTDDQHCLGGGHPVPTFAPRLLNCRLFGAVG